jgi:large subunit ribosomal protein L30
MELAMAEKKMRIRIVKSTIGRKHKQRRTVRALGLRKVNSVVTQKAYPTILGMVNVVKHLVDLEEIK